MLEAAQICSSRQVSLITVWWSSHTHTHTRLTALCPGLPGWAGTRKVKPIWILLEQEIVSGSDISWAICKSAPSARQITTPAPHHSVFYRPDALPATKPTASKHWRHYIWWSSHSDMYILCIKVRSELGDVCVCLFCPQWNLYVTHLQSMQMPVHPVAWVQSANYRHSFLYET